MNSIFVENNAIRIDLSKETIILFAETILQLETNI